MKLPVALKLEIEMVESRRARVLQSSAMGNSYKRSKISTSDEQEVKMIQQIGETAGKVWKYLGEHPGVAPEQISKELKLKDSLIFMGIGCLAREGKLAFEQDGKTTKVSLVAE